MSSRFPIHDSRRIDQLRSELRIEPGRLRRLRIDYFKKSRGVAAALQALPSESQTPFSERVQFHSLTLHERADSKTDGASKLIFKTEPGYLIETVILRPATGRTALCVSSQIGCAASCAFCATGKMRMAHNLSAAEILDQFAQANEQLTAEDRRVRNLVFMGMGEPLHNERNLYEALEALTHPAMFHHPASRILVSTVGVPDAMIRLVRRFPAVNVALSLHTVRQETRAAIVPMARKYPVDRLRDTLVQLNRLQGKPVMLEYLMLGGVNDSLDEAREFAHWCEGLQVHVNLIPYNPIKDATEFTETPRDQRRAFAQTLKDAGIATTTRYSMGLDIEAACGQLVQKDNRAIARSYSKLREADCCERRLA